jgi:hypothetical protein
MSKGNPWVEDPTLGVNDKVSKRSGKPFLSRRRVNTIKELTTNPHTGKPAFKFFEDDSIVDAYACQRALPAVTALTERHFN